LIQVFLHLKYLVFLGFLVMAVLIKIVGYGFPSVIYFRDISYDREPFLVHGTLIFNLFIKTNI